MGNLIFISCSLSISRHSWRRRSRTCHGKWREQTLMREESRALMIEGWEMEQRLEEVVKRNTGIKKKKKHKFIYFSLSLPAGSRESDAYCWAEETDAAEGFPWHLNIRPSSPRQVCSPLDCLAPFSPKIPLHFFCQNSTLHRKTFCPSVFLIYSISFQSCIFFPLFVHSFLHRCPFLLSNLYSAAGFENSTIVS